LLRQFPNPRIDRSVLGFLNNRAAGLADDDEDDEDEGDVPATPAEGAER